MSDEPKLVTIGADIASRTAMLAAIAAYRADPMVVIIDDLCAQDLPTPQLVEEHFQALPSPIRHATVRHGDDLLAMMLRLGAEIPAAPVTPCPTCGKRRTSEAFCLGCGGGLE